MFSFIKGKIMLVLGSLLAASIVVIKILFMVNAKKEHENIILKENAATKDKIHADDIKREKFNASQGAKAEIVNDDSKLVELSEKRGELKDEDTFTTITR